MLLDSVHFITPAAFTAACVLLVSLLSKYVTGSRGTKFASAGKLDYRVTTELSQAVRKHPGKGVKFRARKYSFLPIQY